MITVTYPPRLGEALQALETGDGPGGGGAAERRGGTDGGDETGHGAGGDAGHLDGLESKKME